MTDLTAVRNRSSVPTKLRKSTGSLNRSSGGARARRSRSPRRVGSIEVPPTSGDLNTLMRGCPADLEGSSSASRNHGLRSSLPSSLQSSAVTTTPPSPMTLKQQLELTHAVPQQQLTGVHVSDGVLKRYNNNAACYVESTDLKDMQSLRLNSCERFGSISELLAREEEEDEDKSESASDNNNGIAKFFNDRVSLFKQNVETIKDMAADNFR